MLSADPWLKSFWLLAMKEGSRRPSSPAISLSCEGEARREGLTVLEYDGRIRTGSQVDIRGDGRRSNLHTERLVSGCEIRRERTYDGNDGCDDGGCSRSRTGSSDSDGDYRRRMSEECDRERESNEPAATGAEGAGVTTTGAAMTGATTPLLADPATVANEVLIPKAATRELSFPLFSND